MNSAIVAAGQPLQLGSPEDFQAARAFFQSADFGVETLCGGLKLESLSQLGRIDWTNLVLDGCPASLRWCINIFLRGIPQTSPETDLVVSPPIQAALQRLGLLRKSARQENSLVSPVWVYPCAGFIMVSDRRDDPEGAPFEPAPDVVFPAIYPGTLRFLKLLPAAGFDRCLDHCGGSGIGALLFSRFARTSLTSDIAERSALFAEFNARLNGCAITSLAGDLYAPLGDAQFDFISAHPPFVPATGKTMVYRDAGETGEDVTRRILSGLPTHLAVGGIAMVLCVARDTTDKPLQERVLEWLGAAAGEFDMVYGLEKVLGVEEVVESMRKRGASLSGDQSRQLLERLRSLHTRQFVYGAICLKRLGEACSPKPLRIRMTPETGFADFARLLKTRAWLRRPGANQNLAAARPVLAPALELRARHVVADGEFVPAEFVFSLETDFCSALRVDGFLVPLVARLNGQQSVQQVFAAAEQAGELPKGFALENLLQLVYNLVELGMVQLEPAVSSRS